LGISSIGACRLGGSGKVCVCWLAPVLVATVISSNCWWRLVCPIWRLLRGAIAIAARGGTVATKVLTRVLGVILLRVRTKGHSDRVRGLEGREGLGGEGQHLILLLWLRIEGGCAVSGLMLLPLMSWVGYKVSGVTKAIFNRRWIEGRIWIGGGVVGSAVRTRVHRGRIPGVSDSRIRFATSLVSIAYGG